MANLQSPSVAIKPHGSMSEKMSFYLNLSASNESSAQKQPEQATTPSNTGQTHAAQPRISDIEKAKKG